MEDGGHPLVVTLLQRSRWIVLYPHRNQVSKGPELRYEKHLLED